MKYAEKVIADGATFLYPCNEKTGTICKALKGSDLTYSAGISLDKSSPFGGAVESTVDTADAATGTTAHGVTTGGTLEAWIYVPAATNGSFVKIGNWATTSNGGVSFGIGGTSIDNNGLYLGCLYDWVTFPPMSALQVPTLRWNHVAMVWSGTAITFWLNGTSHAVSASGSPQNPSTAIAVAGNPGSTRTFGGRTAMVAGYTAGLTSAQINDHYSRGLRDGVVY